MKLIKPSFLIKEQECGLEGIYKQIEWAGRHCYKSESAITETSAPKFVQMLIDRGHTAMLEHGTVYLYIKQENEVPDTMYQPIDPTVNKYIKNKYSKVKSISEGEWIVYYFITTNYRVLIENDWLSDLKYKCEPTEHHEQRTTVRFICDRGISHELVRHRVFSFAQESTRYCNYSNDKFGNELTFIKPSWYDGERLYIHMNKSNDSEEVQEQNFNQFLYYCERQYFKLLKQDLKPQDARAILPNALKTEVVMTGFESDWKHFFSLRCATAAHPQMRELAIPLQEQFKLLKFI